MGLYFESTERCAEVRQEQADGGRHRGASIKVVTSARGLLLNVRNSERRLNMVQAPGLILRADFVKSLILNFLDFLDRSASPSDAC
jgi:hypothetical protein